MNNVIKLDAELEREIDKRVNEYTEIKIQDQDQFLMGGESLKVLAGLKKRLISIIKPAKDIARKAHLDITNYEKEKIKGIVLVEGHLRGEMERYEREVREREEKERQKLIEKEEKKAKREREKLISKAEKTEDEDRKEELLEKAENVYAKPVIVEQEVKKTTTLDGGGRVTFKNDISVEVTDIKKYCLAVSEGKMPLSSVNISGRILKQYVKAMGIQRGDHDFLRIEETRNLSVY